MNVHPLTSPAMVDFDPHPHIKPIGLCLPKGRDLFENDAGASSAFASTWEGSHASFPGAKASLAACRPRSGAHAGSSDIDGI